MAWWVCTVLLIALSTADLDVEDKPEEEEKKTNGTIIGIDLGTTYSW